MSIDTDLAFAQFFPDPNIRPFAYLLAKSLRQGHVCLPLSDEDISTPVGIASKQMLTNVGKNMLADHDKQVPFIYQGDRLYLQRYFRYETHIIEHIKQRIASGKHNRERYKKQVQDAEFIIREEAQPIARSENEQSQLSEDERIDWQLIAVIRSMLNDFSIITGGPGTGKTTTLAKLLRILFTIEPNSRVAIAAPTGKASMRMVESLRERSASFENPIREKINLLKPFTLHRLLGYRHQSIYFKHNSSNPLPFDWVIADEASMIDMPIFAKLLDACSPTTRIVLLGDKDQLASVEAGSLFGDICDSSGKLNLFNSDELTWYNAFISDPQRALTSSYITSEHIALSGQITELRYSRRFQQQSCIGKLSLAVIQGRKEDAMNLIRHDNTQSAQFIDHPSDKTLSDFAQGYIEYLEEEDPAEALKKLNKLRVLTAIKEGEWGLHSLNQKMERILHQLRPSLIRPQQGFYNNRPIIVTQNNYSLGLLNGDVGIIRRSDSSGRLIAHFESDQDQGKTRQFVPASITACETVFAMTIHKSQGSEFDDVMIALPNRANTEILTRELVYTGITRAKKSVVIMGNTDVLHAGIEKKVVRFSGIQSRIQQ
jgi:exodeoxyribonuclease V alpha subunit